MSHDHQQRRLLKWTFYLLILFAGFTFGRALYRALDAFGLAI